MKSPQVEVEIELVETSIQGETTVTCMEVVILQAQSLSESRRWLGKRAAGCLVAIGVQVLELRLRV